MQGPDLDAVELIALQPGVRFRNPGAVLVARDCVTVRPGFRFARPGLRSSRRLPEQDRTDFRVLHVN